MLSLCVRCHRVLCNLCGGPFSTWRPLTAFICQFCLLAEYAPLTTATQTFTVRHQLRALIRGRMHLLTVSKRDSSRRQAKEGRESVAKFLNTLGIDLLPASPLALMDYVVYGLTSANLDTTTIRNKLNGIHDLYEYCRVVLRMTSLRSPLRDPQLVILLRSVGVNLKKPTSGSIALTTIEIHGLYHRGWTSDTRRTRWAKNFFNFLNLGMLRHTAVTHLKVCYFIEDGKVHFTADSKVKVYYHSQFKDFIIEIDVGDDDKNSNALKASVDGGRKAYIPFHIPALDMHPGPDLIEYLLRETPPSAGRLFAYPNKKGRGFADKPCSTYNTYLRAAFKTAFPETDPARVSRLGSHSGRKTLAQLLWDAGFARRLIADAGNWFLKRDAIDLYFKTAAYVILNAIASLQLDGSSSMISGTVATRHD